MPSAPKKARASSSPRPAAAKRLTELEVRVGQLEGILEGIGTRLSAVLERLEALASTRELAIGADARATDALEKSDALTERLNHLTLAVAEGIQHVDRAEKRIQATVQRARRELREAGIESPGIEAEASQLRIVDGDGSPDGGVPPMRANVAAPPPTRQELLRERLRELRLSS